MINHKHKFIFVRVAKTASTSILLRLFNDTQNSIRAIQNRYLIDVSEYWDGDRNHYPLGIIKKVVPIKIYNNYFKFGFVRNPWARAVSAYHYSINWYNWRPSKEPPKTLATFKTWLSSLKPLDKYCNQYTFVEGCDFIGKVENLQEDFNIICDKIGIPRQELPHKNKTKHKHYTEHYDEETRKIVAEKFAKDIEYFGYKFGE